MRTTEWVRLKFRAAAGLQLMYTWMKETPGDPTKRNQRPDWGPPLKDRLHKIRSVSLMLFLTKNIPRRGQLNWQKAESQMGLKGESTESETSRSKKTTKKGSNVHAQIFAWLPILQGRLLQNQLKKQPWAVIQTDVSSCKSQRRQSFQFESGQVECLLDK